MLTREELTRWTSALRANPEQQVSGKLTTDGKTGFCCLGKLCEVMGLEPHPYLHLPEQMSYGTSWTILSGEIETKFGDARGEFEILQMPVLGGHISAAVANDWGATWPEIADHFDRYYPCAEEVK
jgi:hypothetical protein